MLLSILIPVYNERTVVEKSLSLVLAAPLTADTSAVMTRARLERLPRHAIVVNTIIAAMVTPTGDPFNLALMAVPMILCYELGILGAWFFGKKKAQEALTRT